MKEAIIRMLNEVDTQGLRCVYAFLANYLPWPEEEMVLELNNADSPEGAAFMTQHQNQQGEEAAQ